MARPRALIEIRYEEAARDYLRSLPLEHFMEATAQATQRKLTLESLDLLASRKPEVQIFNELLVQYPVARQRKPGQVVPDNMVVISDEPVRAKTSYNLPLERERPFWVMDYVSNSSKRKDYDESFDKYEHDLKIPYYLVFYPDNQELTLYRHNGQKYVSVKPNRHGRYPIPRLDLELAILDGWVRYWYQGELLPLPAEWNQELTETKNQLELSRARANEEAVRAEEASHRANDEARRANEEARRADDLQRQLEKALQELAQSRGQGMPSPRQKNGSRSPG